MGSSDHGTDKEKHLFDDPEGVCAGCGKSMKELLAEAPKEESAA